MKPRPFHHQRPLAVCAAALGVGVIAGVFFSWRPWLYGLGLACSLGVLPLLPYLGRKRVTGFLLLSLFLGLLLGGHASHPVLPEAGKYEVTGVLSADVILRENGTAAGYLERAELTGEAGTVSAAKIYWTYTPDEEDPFLPKEGDRVSFTARLYHPQGQVNPYGYDFRMYLLQKGVTAGVSGAADPQIMDHPGRGLSSVLYHVRESLIEKTRQIFGEESALPEALLLGQRDSLPEETVEGFRDAGAAHLLAVSGLHVGLLAGMVLVPLRLLLPHRSRTLVLGAFLLFYCALLDFSAPVVRASLLMMLLQYRRGLRRAPDTLTALCAAFYLMVLIRPLDMFSASFQLSFCAVLGIAAFSRQVARRLTRFSYSLRESMAVSFSAMTGAALPTIQLFHRFSMIGLAVNALLCPLFGVLLPVYAGVLTLGCVYLPLGEALGRFIAPLTHGLLVSVQWIGSLPFASLRVPALPWYCVGAVLAAGALCTRYILGKKRTKALLASGLVLFSFGLWRLTLCRDVQYIQLAMGQADAALILDGNETVLIDAGEYGGDVASYLLSTGRQADKVILTHLHTDHCMGLTELLAQEIFIGGVYLPIGAAEQQIDPQCLELLERLEHSGVPMYYLSNGDGISTSRTTLSVTWPYGDAVRPDQDANRSSLVLLCDLDGLKLLACGDIAGDYELYAARDADVLKVSHHGSKTATGAEFLAAVSPQIALITSSPVSSTLPHADTLNRLEEAGVTVYDTAASGAVTIIARDGTGRILTFLSEHLKP